MLLEEEQMKAEACDTSEAELQIQEKFTVLVRDLYAFYPLLIPFVDSNRQVVQPTSLNVEKQAYFKRPKSRSNLKYSLPQQKVKLIFTVFHIDITHPIIIIWTSKVILKNLMDTKFTMIVCSN